jgi:hypothetical protein
LLPRRAMVLIDFRFRSNSSVANVCNLHQVDSNMNTKDMVRRVRLDGLHIQEVADVLQAFERPTAGCSCPLLHKGVHLGRASAVR